MSILKLVKNMTPIWTPIYTPQDDRINRILEIRFSRYFSP